MTAWSAHLSTLFTELPPLERPAAAAARGFTLCETWWPPAPDPMDWARAVRRAGMRAAAVNADGGDLPAGERGYCNDPDRTGEAVAAAVAAAGVAVAAGGSAVNLLVGRVRPGEPLGARLDVAAQAVRAAADAVAAVGGRLVVEHLNAVDVDGPLLPTPAAAAAFVDRVAHPAVTVLFDAYHAAMAGLDPVFALDDVAGRIGHVQFADHPGRGAPGTGRLDLEAITRRLGELGYDGPVGLEFLPGGPTPAALAALPR
ncbi:MAG: TIM barrel protein [Thermoleophilia bacterium]|nr:TIM barrel protein [Thermoleophilia bacterium]